MTRPIANNLIRNSKLKIVRLTILCEHVFVAYGFVRIKQGRWYKINRKLFDRHLEVLSGSHNILNIVIITAQGFSLNEVTRILRKLNYLFVKKSFISVHLMKLFWRAQMFDPLKISVSSCSSVSQQAGSNLLLGRGHSIWASKA